MINISALLIESNHNGYYINICKPYYDGEDIYWKISCYYGYYLTQRSAVQAAKHAAKRLNIPYIDNNIRDPINLKQWQAAFVD